MAVVVVNKYQPISYINIISNVFMIILLSLFLILLFRTYIVNASYFLISIGIYIIIYNLYFVIYINQIKDPQLLNTFNYRVLNYLCIYNIFLGIILIIGSLILSPGGKGLIISS